MASDERLTEIDALVGASSLGNEGMAEMCARVPDETVTAIRRRAAARQAVNDLAAAFETVPPLARLQAREALEELVGLLNGTHDTCILDNSTDDLADTGRRDLTRDLTAALARARAVATVLDSDLAAALARIRDSARVRHRDITSVLDRDVARDIAGVLDRAPASANADTLAGASYSARTLARGIVHLRGLVDGIARGIARDIVRDRGSIWSRFWNRDIALALAYLRASDITRDLAHVIGRAYTLAHALDRASTFARIIANIDSLSAYDLRAASVASQAGSLLTGQCDGPLITALQRVFVSLSAVVDDEEACERLDDVLQQARDDFRHADLTNADLAGAWLDGVKWTPAATCWPAEWRDRIEQYSVEIFPGVLQVRCGNLREKVPM